MLCIVMQCGLLTRHVCVSTFVGFIEMACNTKHDWLSMCAGWWCVQEVACFFSPWHFLAGETNLFCQWMRYMRWSARQINDKVLSNFKCFIEIFSIFVTLSLSLQMELSKWVKLKKDIPIPYSFLSFLNYFGAGFSYCKYSVR